MKITKVAFNRKFNLGNSETLDASMEAELTEKDNPQEALTILRDNVEMWFIDQQRRKPAANSNTPVDPKQELEEKKRDFDPDLCNWQNKTGSNGDYQMAKDGQDYRKLFVYLLEAEKNFAKISGYSYWLFKDKVTVGRKSQKVPKQ